MAQVAFILSHSHQKTPNISDISELSLQIKPTNHFLEPCKTTRFHGLDLLGVDGNTILHTKPGRHCRSLWDGLIDVDDLMVYHLRI